MISQFFILSERGDTIITRDFRGDLSKTTHEIFFRQAKTWKGDVPPVLALEGINFLHLKKQGLYLLITTRYLQDTNQPEVQRSVLIMVAMFLSR